MTVAHPTCHKLVHCREPGALFFPVGQYAAATGSYSATHSWLCIYYRVLIDTRAGLFKVDLHHAALYDYV